MDTDMAHFQHQYNAPASRSDYNEYSNPVVRTVDSSAPLTGHALGTHQEGAGGVLRHSESSSTSSSEDDGQGGRRKKGIKEKIKEKIPGVGHRHDDRVQASYGTTAAYGTGNERTHEKNGVMDKIKEKLPGHSHYI